MRLEVGIGGDLRRFLPHGQISVEPFPLFPPLEGLRPLHHRLELLPLPPRFQQQPRQQRVIMENRPHDDKDRIRLADLHQSLEEPVLQLLPLFRTLHRLIVLQVIHHHQVRSTAPVTQTPQLLSRPGPLDLHPVAGNDLIRRPLGTLAAELRKILLQPLVGLQLQLDERKKALRLTPSLRDDQRILPLPKSRHPERQTEGPPGGLGITPGSGVGLLISLSDLHRRPDHLQIALREVLMQPAGRLIEVVREVRCAKEVQALGSFRLSRLLLRSP